MPGFGNAGLMLPQNPTADVIAAYNNALSNQFNTNAQYDTASQDRAFRGYLAQQQLGARTEDRNLFLSLLSGANGVGSGSAFGGQAAQLFNQNMTDIGNMGAGQVNRINQDFTDTANSAQARLEARGLGGSNLVGAAQLGAQREKQQAMLDLQDKLAGLRVGARSAESARQTDIMKSLLGQFGNFSLNFDFGGA